MNGKNTLELAALMGLCAGGILLSGCRTQYSDCTFGSAESVGKVISGSAPEEVLSVQYGEVKGSEVGFTDGFSQNPGPAFDDDDTMPMPSHMQPKATGEVTYAAAQSASKPEYWQTHSDPYAAELAKKSEKTKPAAVVAAKGVSRDDGYVTYIVKKGDTLGGIAQRNGVKLKDVQALNANIDYNRIKVGQKIYLPKSAKAVAASPALAAVVTSDGYYVVKNGDILGRIARQFGVRVSDLKAANNITDANKIKVGQKLKIPGKGEVKAVAPSVKKAVVKPVAEKKTVTETVKVETVKTSTVEPPVAPAIIPEDAVPEIPTMKTAEPDSVIQPLVSPELPEPAAKAAEPGAVAESGYTTYVVREGDNDLFDIAVNFGMPREKIQSANPGIADVPKPGTTIKIPLQ